ncbi:HAD-IIIA family hydrolase [Brevundimonas sp.]|uniref:HAD-IIIA family hydrolase n=1 Tax=Brevundimonas sp. TaxID=1871086 RepID=UPI001AC1C586|nr:HAD-IIIA family hydrolase [Brevundimonas sp.]MBN9464768.1 HAD-IIIA family hydrolase [Brevundimonas sp.]
MQAVILAGGKGTRLAERLNGRPKPLIDVLGVPLLERQLDTLAKQGIANVVVLVNHAADQIEDFFASRPPTPTARLIDDGAPRGTAGAVLACLETLEERFVVVYGDTLFEIDIPAMLAEHEASGADLTLLLHPNDHPADSDLVEVDENGWVTAFHGYPHPPGADLRNLVNAAFYICERRALETWRQSPAPLDFAKDLFPRMLAQGMRIRGYLTFEYIKDLGTPKRLDKVERHLASGVVERAGLAAAQRVAFLDRDGVINVQRDYVRTPDDFELIPGAIEAVRMLNEAEFRVIVVTNQPVIARGEADFDAVHRIHARMESLLGAGGAYIDALYLCPHHPDKGFRGEVAALKGPCRCRKPGTGLFEQAANAMKIDFDASWMVGDSTSDIEAGRRMKLNTILVETGTGGRDQKWTVQPSHRAADLLAAARIICAPAMKPTMAQGSDT